jgi:hypothetical protein
MLRFELMKTEYKDTIIFKIVNIFTDIFNERMLETGCLMQAKTVYGYLKNRHILLYYL